MQSMGKGRARAYAVIWGLGAIVLGVHIATRDYVRPAAIVQEQVNWRDAHLEIIGAIEQKSTSPLALLLGGSNIIYGLSAEALSSSTGVSFFNLGLFREGFSFDRYLEFVQSALGRVQNQDVDLIIYSTVDFFRNDFRDIDIFGLDAAGLATTEIGARASILPGTPVFTRVQDLFSSITSSYHVEGERGDLDFGYIDCSGEIWIPNEVYDKAFAAEYSGVLLERVLRIQASYPSARIVVTVPARLNVARQLLESEIKVYSETLVSHGIEFIVEIPFEDASDLCDSANHPSDGGRTSRTDALARDLLALGVFD